MEDWDRRVWLETDRPGERLHVVRPLTGLEIMSVRGSHRHWRDAHDTFTLALIRRDQEPVVAGWRTRGRSVSSVRGEVMAIEAGEVHITQRLELQAGSASFDVVRFAPGLVASAAQELAGAPRFHFSSSVLRAPTVFDTLHNLVDVVSVGSELDLECATADALRALVLHSSETPPRAVLDPVRDYRLRRVRDFLKEHVARRPTLAELELVSGLSQYRLAHLFKQSYGMSIGQYWNAVRLNEAVRRLQDGASIKMLVSELGYVDEPYFNRTFKKHYGVPPGAWYRAVRQNDSVRCAHLRKGPEKRD